jgi:DNA ligase (NAD+)
MLKNLRVTNLVEELNRHRHMYYNEEPEISDAEYDAMYDELEQLERETGLIMSNSPTQTVGAPVLSGLSKVTHPIQLLSLDKTKDYDELCKFIGTRPTLYMLKMDGLTVKLEYNGGELVRASTRGDGDEGDDITHNARHFKNIPLYIPYKEKLTVTGEAIIMQKDFERMRETLVRPDGKKYKTARNLAAGSVRHLDSGESAKRCIHFISFGVLEGLKGMCFALPESGDAYTVDANSKYSMLQGLKRLGFRTVYAFLVNSNKPLLFPGMHNDAPIEYLTTHMKAYAAEMGLPIDGLVASYDDVAYSKSLGKTGHHYLDGKAYKFEDETEEAALLDVKWTVTRTGELSAVANFETVELDGTEVSNATLHNLDVIREHDLHYGDRLLVCKRNMIIPHIEENLDKGIDRPMRARVEPPHVCPSCRTELIRSSPDKNGKGSALYCPNSKCPGRQLRKLVHFACKKAMNIKNVGKDTLKRLIDEGFLRCEADFYTLHQSRTQLCKLKGFGEDSVDNLLNAIEASRTTTMEQFIIAMDIPDLGRHASKILCRHFNYSLTDIAAAAEFDFDFTQLEDFGDTLNENIHTWFSSNENVLNWNHISGLMTFETPKTSPAAPAETENPFYGKTVVATGKLERFTRESINETIVSLGANAGSSVSAKTDFVIAGEKAGSKKQKAESLGVRILSENEFIEMAGL